MLRVLLFIFSSCGGTFRGRTHGGEWQDHSGEMCNYVVKWQKNNTSPRGQGIPLAKQKLNNYLVSGALESDDWTASGDNCTARVRRENKIEEE